MRWEQAQGWCGGCQKCWQAWHEICRVLEPITRLNMIWRQIPLMVERYWISACFEIFEIWEREGSPLVSGRVLLQHAIFGLGASMVSTLFSFKDSTIHNLSWNYAKCQPLVSQTWRKPLAMLGPRSSSGDCCALLSFGKLTAILSLCFVHEFNLRQTRVWISYIFGSISRLSNHNPTTPMDHWMSFGGTCPVTTGEVPS